MLSFVKFRGGFPPGRKGWKVVRAATGIVYSEHLYVRDALAAWDYCNKHYADHPEDFIITDAFGFDVEVRLAVPKFYEMLRDRDVVRD